MGGMFLKENIPLEKIKLENLKQINLFVSFNFRHPVVSRPTTVYKKEEKDKYSIKTDEDLYQLRFGINHSKFILYTYKGNQRFRTSIYYLIKQ